MIGDDEQGIERLFALFLAAFDNTNGAAPGVDRIFDLFIVEGIIVNATTTPPIVSNVRDFVEPRRRILTDGTLTDFSEREVSGRTQIFGAVAQRLSVYEKRGVLRGVPFETRGMKTSIFVRTEDGWKISALAWDDEREGGGTFE